MENVEAMRYLAALLMLLPTTATTEQLNPQWFWSVGYCTATDRAELGGCGTLEVMNRPDWSK